MTTGEILTVIGLIVTALTFLWNQVRTTKNLQEAENKKIREELHKAQTRLEVLQEYVKSLPAHRDFATDFDKFEARLESKFDTHLKTITELVKAAVERK
jgi:hypothetical protein